MTRARAVLPLLLALGLSGALPCRAEETKRWFKGNTHTHTLWSDGDAAPEAVVDWYRSNGYHFLVLSDHNVLAEGERWVGVGTAKGDRVPPARLEELVARFGSAAVTVREREGRREMRLRTLEELRKTFEERDRFLLVTGEEVTDKFKDRPIHHGAVNTKNLIRPTGGESVRDVLERTVRAAEEEAKRSGRPVFLHLNHPNFGWALTPDDVAHVTGERFFEVLNGHRGTRNHGDAEHASTERIWDHALALRLGKIGGEPLRALATDDAHNYFEGANAKAGPGRGWVMVRAASLEPDALVRALLAGDFYATSGVTLESVVADAKSVAVRIAAEPGVTYTTRFVGTRASGDRVGAVGVVLKEAQGAAASYAFDGDELYVRAQVVSSRRHPNPYAKDDLETAWAQPVVVRRLAR